MVVRAKVGIGAIGNVGDLVVVVAVAVVFVFVFVVVIIFVVVVIVVGEKWGSVGYGVGV